MYRNDRIAYLNKTITVAKNENFKLGFKLVRGAYHKKEITRAKKNGYKTISLGKIYHHSNDDIKYWDVLDPCRIAAYTKTANKEIVSSKIELANKLKLKGTDYRKATTGPAFESNDVLDNAYGDGLITERAIYQIKNRTDKPFFLGVGFIYLLSSTNLLVRFSGVLFSKL